MNCSSSSLSSSSSRNDSNKLNQSIVKEFNKLSIESHSYHEDSFGPDELGFNEEESGLIEEDEFLIEPEESGLIEEDEFLIEPEEIALIEQDEFLIEPEELNFFNQEISPSIEPELLESNLKDKNSKLSKECYYCKLAYRNCLIKCNGCDIFFCNGKGRAPSSHIIYHLIRSEHKEIDFQLLGSAGKSDCCNICDSRDIFNLGFVSSNKNKNYILCTPPCRKTVKKIQGGKTLNVEEPVHENNDEYFKALNNALPNVYITGQTSLMNYNNGITYKFRSNTKYENVNILNWKPVIENKHLIDLVVQKPSLKEQLDQCEKATLSDIEKLEDDLDKMETEDSKFLSKLPPVLLQYENGSEYSKTFAGLLKLETAMNRSAQEDAEAFAYIIKTTESALKDFKVNKNKIHSFIYDVILGKKIIESSFVEESYFDLDKYNVPKLPKLNQSQAYAVNHSLNNPITLIQGPPGTGKTHTAASIAYNFIKSSTKKQQVLIAAPSNIAADNLAQKIKQTGLKVIRILSKTKELDTSYKSPLSIHHKIKKPDPDSELANFYEFLGKNKLRTGRITKREADKLEILTKKYIRQLINEADVICVTCLSSANSKLAGRKFKYLIIDEVGQCQEPEVIIPLNSGVQKLVLIGDIQQLSPVIKNKIACEKGFDQSMMQRLAALGNKSFMLNEQYRMHPFISEFSRLKFYDGELKDGITNEDRILKTKFQFMNPLKPGLFLSCKETEQSSSTGLSYLNRKEGNEIGKLVFKLVREGIKESQIGIITPYEGQRSHLRSNLKFFNKKINYDLIEIASINAYQGREKEIIILSTVRSNKLKCKNSIGFLRDTRRLNVALTRAKYGIIIIGDEDTLCNEPIWYELLKFYQDNGLIFSQSIDNLKVCETFLKKPTNLADQEYSRLENKYFKKVYAADNKDPNKKVVRYKKIRFFI